MERPIEEDSREATPEETPGPEDDTAGFNDQASRGTFLESADTLMSLNMEGSELPNNATSMASSPMISSRIDCIRELLIQMPQAPEMPPEMDEVLLPGATCLHQSIDATSSHLSDHQSNCT